jgi:hypothetical protein
VARKAKTKSRKRAPSKAKPRTAKFKTARRGARPRKARTSPSTRQAKTRQGTRNASRPSLKSQAKQAEPIPAEPAGRIGLRRPSNEPKAPGPKEPRELAQAEPDARFDDRREPERTAHDFPDGIDPSGYKNTDEKF